MTPAVTPVGAVPVLALLVVLVCARLVVLVFAGLVRLVLLHLRRVALRVVGHLAHIRSLVPSG
ncbi:hypothetical protein [Ornithinimicrobium sp. LYQ121]|uniref:hypothetical protein n=1 Tax=Ornithinimicrobium sp. LYQ121 TaxID=3378801 RepID=UPI0038620B7A